MIIRTSNGAYYINGLFAEAVKNTETFNSNVYFSYLLMKTLDQARQLKTEYEAAIEGGDEALATQKRMEVDSSEDALVKACFMLQHFDGVDA